jgi:uncharacterized protein (TIGR02145 family)
MKRRFGFFLLMILLLIGLSFCSKEEPVSGDQVIGLAYFLSTDDVNSITCVSARSGGYIIENVGGNGVWTTQGVCWSTTPHPTTADNKAIGGILSDPRCFHSTLTGLNSGTTYYVRAYATNSAGITYYGNELHFSIPGARLPIVVTDTVVIISTPKNAQIGFNMTTDVGCDPFTTKGVCWSTTPNPTTADNKTIGILSDPPYFHSTLTGLNCETTYYVRAYAINSAGTAYGNEVSFTTPASFPQFIGSVSDIDGNVYKTIQIGSQTWMAENLKTSKYNDGSQIPEVNGGYYWVGLKTGAYFSLKDAATYKNTYGSLYNWYAVKTGKLCPTGWHVPSDDEWKQLEMALGMTQAEADSWGGEDYGDIMRGTDQGTQMRATGGWDDWEGKYGNGTNTSGFSGLPGGDTGWDGKLEINGLCGSWWSSTEGVARVLSSGDGKVGRAVYYTHIGFNVRCLKY